MSLPKYLALLTLAACGGGNDALTGDDVVAPDADPGADADVEPDAGPEACAATTVSDDPAFEGYLEVIRARMESAGIPGAAIGVIDGSGNVLHRAVLGSKGPGVCGAITSQTRFRVGPIAAAVTGAVVVAAAANDLIDLDAPVTTYVPEMTQADGITIANLLTRTSGFVPAGSPSPPCAPGPDGLQTWLASKYDVAPWAPAGRAFNWDLRQATLAASALERAATSTFAQVAETYLFDPLGMTATYSEAEAMLGDYTPGTNDGVNVTSGPDCAALMPEQHLFASLDDTLAFARLLIAGDVDVMPDALSDQLRVVPGAEAYYPSWGSGYALEEVPFRQDGSKIYLIHGKSRGYASQAWLSPDLDLGIVLLINRGSDAISELLSEGFFRLAGVTYDPPSGPTAVETWAEYAGTYVDDLGLTGVPPPRTFTVTFDGAQLFLDAGQGPLVLTPEYSGLAGRALDQDAFTFVYGGETNQLRFYRDPDTGAPDLIWSYWTGLGPSAHRVAEVAAVEAALCQVTDDCVYLGGVNLVSGCFGGWGTGYCASQDELYWSCDCGSVQGVCNSSTNAPTSCSCTRDAACEAG